MDRRDGLTLIGLLLLVTFLVAPWQPVRADAGPKPTMEFRFVYEMDTPLLIEEGTLYECDEADCADAEPLMEAGPQGLYCDTTSCHSTAYGYDPYHRLAIHFSDGETRESNIFSKRAFAARYQVTVRQNDLLVEEDPWYRTPLGMALSGGGLLLFTVCGLGVALVVGAILLLVRWIAKARA